MKSKLIEYRGNGISFPLDDKIHLLYGLSGSGKSFMLNILYEGMINEGIKIAFLDYKLESVDVDKIINLVKGVDLIIADNADLYMTKDLWDAINLEKVCTYMALRGVDDEYSLDKTDFYRVNYSENSLYLEKVG